MTIFPVNLAEQLGSGVWDLGICASQVTEG